MQNAFLWTALDKFGNQAITFATQLILARILLPDEFGLVAMVAVFIGIGRALSDGGLGIAIIQKKNLSKEDIDTAFVSNIIIAVVFYAILFFAAPSIADFYNNVRVTIVLRFLGLSFLIQSFFITTQGLLNRELKFKEIAISNSLSALISAFIAIIYVYYQADVYALILYQVVNMLLRTVFFSLYASIRPRFRLSIRSIKELYGYSIGLLGVILTDEIFSYLYVIVIGRVMSDYAAGIYNMAHLIIMYSTISISIIVEKISLPILSRLYHSDMIAFEKEYVVFLEITSFILFPVVLGIFSSSDSMIVTLLGEQWMESAQVLKILSLAFIVFPILIMMITYFKVTGDTKKYFFGSLIGKVSMILGIWLTYNHGLIEIAYSYIVVSVLTFLAYSVLFFNANRGLFLSQFKIITPFFAAAIFMMLIIAKIKFENITVTFILQIIVGAIIYLLILHAFNRNRLILILNKIRNVL